MTVTSVTGPGRVVQFLWGPNAENTLQISYPAGVDEPRFWRNARRGSEQVVMNDKVESWLQGRDYFSKLKLRWIPLSLWGGGDGVQVFLDWATGSQPFSLVPDAVAAPLFNLPGCLLVEPFTNVKPTLEADGSQSIDVTFRNPTYDLGLSWR